MSDSKRSLAPDLDYFNQFTEGYAPYAEVDLDLLVTKFINHVNLGAEGLLRVCEVGSASGQFSAALAQRVLDREALFLGMDIAHNVLALYPFGRVCGSGLRMPTMDGAFDIICYPASLHHLAPFPDAVAEMSRVLAPGGYMYCVEPNIFHPHRRYFMRFPKLYRRFRKVNDVPVNPCKLEELLCAHGLRVITVEYVNITFRRPSALQRMQNLVAWLGAWDSLAKHVLPWFVMVAVKETDLTAESSSSTMGS